jgi:RHS repeat-associated protein
VDVPATENPSGVPILSVNSNLLSVTDARSNAINYAYDNMDRVQTRTDPLTRASSYQYNNNGSVKQITDRKNQVTNYTYDALERLTQVTYADASTTSYTYDGGSRLTQITDSLSGTISYTYDDLDRVASEATPQGTVSYTYDALGRRASMSVPGQSTVNYTYDNANRLTQITQGSSTVSFAYDAGSRTTSQTLPNGVVTEYSYDDASRLVGLTYRKGANILGNVTYEYDAAGRRTRIGGSLASTGLPQAVSTTSYNAANHQTGFGSQTLSYDNNGNLTSDGANTFTWNARNQLVSMSGPGLTASFQYDALGRRRSKTINGNTLSFLYDGLNIVQEQSGGSAFGNMLTGGVDQFFSRTDAGGTVTPLADALGSVVGQTDVAGNIQTQYTYEPFGNTVTSGVANANSQKYTGREDDGTGLYFYRARYYSPALQRFITEDPIGLLGGINSYAFVDNNPLCFSDPLGLKPDNPFDDGGTDSGFGGFPPRRPFWDKGGPRWYEPPTPPEPPPGPPPLPPGPNGPIATEPPPTNPITGTPTNPTGHPMGNPNEPMIPQNPSFWWRTRFVVAQGMRIISKFIKGTGAVIVVITPEIWNDGDPYNLRGRGPRIPEARIEMQDMQNLQQPVKTERGARTAFLHREGATPRGLAHRTLDVRQEAKVGDAQQ